MDDKSLSDIKTSVVLENVSKCETIEDLKNEFCSKLRTQQEQWRIKIQEIVKESGYTNTKFAELCDVSRVTLDKWFKGSLPKNRETLLRIGMVANYSVEKMNQLLQRYGRYPGLYSKSLEDCVCIFVINQNYKKEEALGKYYYILERVKNSISEDGSSKGAEEVSTEVFNDALSKIKDEEGIEQFIRKNIEVFSYSYHKLYAAIKVNLEANYGIGCTSTYELANGQGWSSSLRQCVSAINQNKWYPTRNKIISLGIHMSMNYEQIDGLLALAHMEPLCAKNIFENIIIFILVDAECNNMLKDQPGEKDPDQLIEYTREVLLQLDIPEINDFILEVSEKKI